MIGDRWWTGSWALGELVVTLGRATLWVRTRRYDTVARAGAAQHVAALGGFAPPQVDLSRNARARSLAPHSTAGRASPVEGDLGHC